MTKQPTKSLVTRQGVASLADHDHDHETENENDDDEGSADGQSPEQTRAIVPSTII